jgi:hypothetical protein
MRVRPSYVLALTGSTLLMAACAQPAGPVQSGTSTDVGAGAASQSPPNGCLIGSIDNLMTSHPADR